MAKKKKSEPTRTPKGVPGGKGAWKLMDRGATIASGVLARKISALTWQTATRRKPPADSSHPDTDVREVVAWAVIGGATVELVKVMVHRGATSYWMRSTGELPPGLTPLEETKPAPDEPVPVQVKKKLGRSRRGRRATRG